MGVNAFDFATTFPLTSCCSFHFPLVWSINNLTLLRLSWYQASNQTLPLTPPDVSMVVCTVQLAHPANAGAAMAVAFAVAAAIRAPPVSDQKAPENVQDAGR